MPLYEYRCRDCGHQFEALVREAPPAGCTACGSADIVRCPSLFGVATDGTRESSRRRAKQDMQKTNRDRVVAERERIEKHHH